MRVIHVVPSITNEASGPSYSVVRLCESLIAEGQDLTLAALDWAPMENPPAFLKTFPVGLGPRRLGRSPRMCRWLFGQIQTGTVDLLHNHGMWQMNAAYPGWAARKRSTNFVVSPRGAFSEWALSNGSAMKKVFWPLIQRPAIEAATCFHATADSEYADIRRMGFHQPVAIIPNGIDMPTLLPRAKKDYRTLLFLGRIHPTKGLDMLLPAWHAVQDSFPDWHLKIVGPDNRGYLDKMRRLSSELRLERVEFSGPQFGAQKWRAYREADLFVLPTYSENFGMAVAEALVAGIPAIVSKGAPWFGLERHAAGWWIDIGVDSLASCLSVALSCSPDELGVMGMRGRSWMESEYSWQRIGAHMADTYRWLLDRTLPVPAWVRLD